MDVILVVAMAVKEALSLCISKSFQHVQIETDAEIVVNALIDDT